MSEISIGSASIPLTGLVRLMAIVTENILETNMFNESLTHMSAEKQENYRYY